MFLSSTLARRPVKNYDAMTFSTIIMTRLVLLSRHGTYYYHHHHHRRRCHHHLASRFFSSPSNNNNNNKDSGSSIGGGHRLTVKKPLSKQQQQSVQQMQLIRTNLQQHLEYISSKDPTKVSPNAFGAKDDATFESGIVPHDWTDSMIDLTSAFDARLHLPNALNFHKKAHLYEEATPLSTQMISYMAVRSQPLTIAEFMRQALCHEEFGYYTNPPSFQNHDTDDDLFNDDNTADDQNNNNDDDNWDLDDPTKEKASKSDYIIGRRGDFVTAPEVSQVFGEMLAVWFVTQYTNQSAMMTTTSTNTTTPTPSSLPRKENKHTNHTIRLVEVGPGKGTLLQDVLRSLAWLKPTMAKSISEIHLIEQSQPMRQEQQRKLQALMSSLSSKSESHEEDEHTTKNDDDDDDDDEIIKNKMKEIPNFKFVFHGDNYDNDTQNDNHEKLNDTQMNDSTTTTSNKNDDNNDTTTTPIHVYWHASFSNFMYFIKDHDKDNNHDESTTTTTTTKMPTFVICQEFIDALPVHVFEKLESGWRERMVDVTLDEDDDVTDNNKNNDTEKDDKKKTSNSNENMNPDGSSTTTTTTTTNNTTKKTRLRVVVSPTVSPACQTLLNVDENGQMEHDNSPVGSVIEVCPEGILLVQDISKLITDQGGAALIVDYGMEGSSDSLRGFSKHKQVSFLSRPGQVDVTADVDFSALRHAVNHYHTTLPSKQNNNSMALDDSNNKKKWNHDISTTAFAFGPVTQGKFLTAMGAAERVISLIEHENTTDEQAEELYHALERLCLPEHMGERYKVLAIARKKDGIFAPPGFEQ